MTVSLNGIAHIYITVEDFRFGAKPFYVELLHFFEMVPDRHGRSVLLRRFAHRDRDSGARANMRARLSINIEQA